MSGRGVMAFALLAALLLAAAASSAGSPKDTDALQQLRTKTENGRMLRAKQQPESQANRARVQRRVQLSDDARELMTKQIMQAISGTKLSEVTSPPQTCLVHRWVCGHFSEHNFITSDSCLTYLTFWQIIRANVDLNKHVPVKKICSKILFYQYFHLIDKKVTMKYSFAAFPAEKWQQI